MDELKKALMWAKKYEVLDIDITGHKPIVFLTTNGFEALITELNKIPMTIPIGKGFVAKMFESDGIIFRNIRGKNE